MSNLEFYIVDVFAEERYAGNPLAVIRGAAGLSDEEMQKIAREMNYSETTFILSDMPHKEGGHDVRIFTVGSELPFAGHPTLGTAYIIQYEIMPAMLETIPLNLKIGQISVSFEEDGVLWMQQHTPEFGHTFGHAVMASVLGLEPDEMDDRYPVQSVSTGLPFIIVPVKSLHAVRRIKLDQERCQTLIDSVGDSLEPQALLVFCPETYDEAHDLNARVFVLFDDMGEDPATGSANGCLAAYLANHDYFGPDEVECSVEQGYEIKRPSLLRLRAKTVEDGFDVMVGGRVQMVARGQLIRTG